MATAVVQSGLLRRVQWTVRTTDGTNTLLQWLNLPSAGSGAYFNGNITAQQDNAQRVFVQTYVGTVNRNSTGTGAGLSISVGPNGYTDTVTTPWTSPGSPAGWNAVVHDLSASPIISFQVQGAAAQNIDWLATVDVYLWGGAVILLT